MRIPPSLVLAGLWPQSCYSLSFWPLLFANGGGTTPPQASDKDQDVLYAPNEGTCSMASQPLRSESTMKYRSFCFRDISMDYACGVSFFLVLLETTVAVTQFVARSSFQLASELNALAAGRVRCGMLLR